MSHPENKGPDTQLPSVEPKPGPQLDPANKYWPVSPLVDIEIPSSRWTPGARGGLKPEDGGFIGYVKSKNPGLAPHGWRDITPYFGKQWPKTLSSWRTLAQQHGYYISIKLIEKDGLRYRAILVCLNPDMSQVTRRVR